MPQYMRRVVLDPIPELGAIRDAVGVQKIVTPLGLPAYLVTRYGDVKAALADPERFSNRKPPGWGADSTAVTTEEHAQLSAGNLLGIDPPQHQRLRRMLTPRIHNPADEAPGVAHREIVEQQLDAMEQAGSPADLVASFALPIPSLVICELLGVPYDDREDFQRRSSRQLNFRIPTTERFAEQRASPRILMTLVRRARRKPGEDMLGMLVREHGTEVSDDELVGIGGLLLLAGHETTSNMLSLGTIALLQHPDQLAAVRDDPYAAGRPSRNCCDTCRWCRTRFRGSPPSEVEVGGVVIPAGHLVIPLAARWQSRSPLHPRAGRLRHQPRRARSPGIRPRCAPLPRGAAGADGNADRFPGIAAPLPTPGARRRTHRRAVPRAEPHLRRRVAEGEVVTRESCGRPRHLHRRRHVRDDHRRSLRSGR